MSAEFAQRLIDAGVPVVVCRPNPKWAPGARDENGLPERELFAPKGWMLIEAKDCDISSFRPGIDTLAMVGGHGVDVVDVDTKDGGTLDNLPPFEYFGETMTPSGGVHRYVRSTGIGKLSPLTTSAGHVGDYVGGTPQGGGRLLAYLPGSTRPKYPNATYIATEPLELDVLLESDPDDNLIAALIGCGGRRQGDPGRPAARLSDVERFLAEHSEITEPCAYGRAAIRGMLNGVSDIVPGDPVRGRHGWATRTAARMVELVKAGCATSADLDEIEQVLWRIKPEGEDWYGIVAWALANADGSSACTVHGPAMKEFVASLPETYDAGDQNATAATRDADDITEERLDAAAQFAKEVAFEAYRLKVRDAAVRKVAQDRVGAAVRPATVSLDAFLEVEDDEVVYRVERLWPTGGRVILAAQYKAGKSTLIGNVIRSLADGEPLLGQYATEQTTVALIDNELDERTLRRWLRDQGIQNRGQVKLVPLRGKVSSFDILDPETRAEWAESLKGVDVVILDCLRPVLDALGLSEDKEAGRFLVAFDALLSQAGVSEAAVVHHMGHSGERSRGDSRILDWPDATWKLVREDADDPGSPRYFSAFGRDVEVSESRLAYDVETRHLSLTGGSRKESAADELMEPLLELLEGNPEGMSGRQIEVALQGAGYRQADIRAAVKRASVLGRTFQSEGPRRSILHRISPSALSALPVRQRTEIECVSASYSATHTLTHSEDEVSASATHTEDLDWQNPKRELGRVCSRCGRPLLIEIPGRDVCEKCRLKGGSERERIEGEAS